MKTKLTLSIEPDLIEFAHQTARQQGQSISGLVSNFLQVQKSRADKAVVPAVAEIAGSLKKYQINDSKQGIRDSYAEKYLR